MKWTVFFTIIWSWMYPSLMRWGWNFSFTFYYGSTPPWNNRTILWNCSCLLVTISFRQFFLFPFSSYKNFNESSTLTSFYRFCILTFNSFFLKFCILVHLAKSSRKIFNWIVRRQLALMFIFTDLIKIHTCSISS